MAIELGIPVKGSASPEDGITRTFAAQNTAEFNDDFRAFLESPGNSNPNQPFEDLHQGLTRAANVGEYGLVQGIDFNIYLNSIIDALNGNTDSIYFRANQSLNDPNRSNVLQRLQISQQAVPVIESIKAAARGEGVTPIMPSDDKLAPIVRVLVENNSNAKDLGDSLKKLSQSPSTQAYAEKIKQTVASVVAADRASLSTSNLRKAILLQASNGTEKALFSSDLSPAGSVEVLTGPTADKLTTVIEPGQNHFNNGFNYDVDVTSSSRTDIINSSGLFKFNATSWTEINTLKYEIFANKAELDAAIDALPKQPDTARISAIPPHIAQQVDAIAKPTMLAPHTAVNPAVGIKQEGNVAGIK